jgi:hypothetical protein
MHFFSFSVTIPISNIALKPISKHFQDERFNKIGANRNKPAFKKSAAA